MDALKEYLNDEELFSITSKIKHIEGNIQQDLINLFIF